MSIYICTGKTASKVMTAKISSLDLILTLHLTNLSRVPTIYNSQPFNRKYEKQLN